MERWADERCDEIAIERIADLEWTSGIEVQGSGSEAVALFRLTATPTGRAGGGAFTVDTVGGTPLFTSADGDFWTVGQRVRSDGPVVTMELPAQPARCDSHSFGAATGGTTFFVNITIGQSRAAQIRLAMSPEVPPRRSSTPPRCAGGTKDQARLDARTRRLVFVVVILLLTFPLISTMITRARVERSGVDVTATVVEAGQKGESYLVAFLFPERSTPTSAGTPPRSSGRRTSRRPRPRRSRSACSRAGRKPTWWKARSTARPRTGSSAWPICWCWWSACGRSGSAAAAAGAPAGPRSSRARGRRRGRVSGAGARRGHLRSRRQPAVRPTTPRPCSTSANAALSSPWTATPTPSRSARPPAYAGPSSAESAGVLVASWLTEYPDIRVLRHLRRERAGFRGRNGSVGVTSRARPQAPRRGG